MKKKLLITVFIMVVSLLVVGCGKKGDNKEEKKVSDWEISMNQTFEFFDEDIKKAFDDAVNSYTDMKLTPLA